MVGQRAQRPAGSSEAADVVVGGRGSGRGAIYAVRGRRSHGFFFPFTVVEKLELLRRQLVPPTECIHEHEAAVGSVCEVRKWMKLKEAQTVVVR
jgi:hypothetical protein